MSSSSTTPATSTSTSTKHVTVAEEPISLSALESKPMEVVPEPGNDNLDNNPVSHDDSVVPDSEPVPPVVVDETPKPTKTKPGLFGSLFRRSKTPKTPVDSVPSPGVTATATTEDVTPAVTDEVNVQPNIPDKEENSETSQLEATDATVPLESVSESVTETPKTELTISTKTMDASVRTATDVSTKSSNSKFFSFSRKKVNNSEGSLLSPVDTPTVPHPEPVNEEPVTESPEMVAESVDNKTTETTSIDADTTSLVVEDEPISSPVTSPSEDKRKSGIFGRLALLRKHSKEVKTEVVTSALEEEVVLPPVTNEAITTPLPEESEASASDAVAPSVHEESHIPEVTEVLEETIKKQEEVFTTEETKEPDVEVPAETTVTAHIEESTLKQATVEVIVDQTPNSDSVQETNVTDEVNANENSTDESNMKSEEPSVPQSEMSDMSEPTEPVEESNKKVVDRQSGFLGGILQTLSRRSKTTEDQQLDGPINESEVEPQAVAHTSDVVDSTIPAVEGEIMSENEPEVNDDVPATSTTDKVVKKKLSRKLTLFRSKASEASPDESADDAPIQTESSIKSNDPIVRGSYLLKPAALTRAIHRRYFTLHASGSLAMRMNASDPIEIKSYTLTLASNVSIPASSKVDYELFVKISNKKTIVLVTCSESEREAWLNSIMEVIENLRDRRVEESIKEEMSSPIHSSAPVVAAMEPSALEPLTIEGISNSIEEEMTETNGTPLMTQDDVPPKSEKIVPETTATNAAVPNVVESSSTPLHEVSASSA